MPTRQLDRLAARYLPTTVGWAVRRTWKPWGDHEFVCWRATQAKAMRAAAADRAYWSIGLMAPVHHLVQMSLAEFRDHARRQQCSSADCTLDRLVAPACRSQDGEKPL